MFLEKVSARNFEMRERSKLLERVVLFGKVVIFVLSQLFLCFLTACCDLISSNYHGYQYLTNFSSSQVQGR